MMLADLFLCIIWIEIELFVDDPYNITICSVTRDMVYFAKIKEN